MSFYIFIINGRWEEPLYKLVEQNFSAVARSIGKNVIAKGLDPQEFTGEVERKYLGEDHGSLFSLLPALLITNAHPDRITEQSMRLLVPLKDAEARFGGWSQFFGLLSDFVQGKNDEFVRRFERKEDLIDLTNRVVELKPGVFGVSININEVIAWWRRRSAPAGA